MSTNEPIEMTFVEHLKIVGTTSQANIPQPPAKKKFRIFKNKARSGNYEGRLNKKLLPEEIRTRLPSSAEGKKQQKINEQKRREIAMVNVSKSVHDAAMKKDDPLEGLAWSSQEAKPAGKKTAPKVKLDENNLRKFDAFLSKTGRWDENEAQARKSAPKVTPKATRRQAPEPSQIGEELPGSSSRPGAALVGQSKDKMIVDSSPNRGTQNTVTTSRKPAAVSPELAPEAKSHSRITFQSSPNVTEPTVELRKPPPQMPSTVEVAKFRSNTRDSDGSDEEEEGSYVSVEDDSFEAWMQGQEADEYYSDDDEVSEL